MTKTSADKIDDFESQIDPEVLAVLKAKLREEIQSDNNKIKEDLKKQRESEERSKKNYIKKMGSSTLPWFTLIASPPENDFVIDEGGMSYQLEWNTAFQKFLVDKKVLGSDDLQRTESFLIELLHGIIEKAEEDKMKDGDSEFE